MSLCLDIASPCFMFCSFPALHFFKFFPTFTLLIQRLYQSSVLSDTRHKSDTHILLVTQSTLSKILLPSHVTDSVLQFVSSIHVQDLSHQSALHLHGTGYLSVYSLRLKSTFVCCSG